MKKIVFKNQREFAEAYRILNSWGGFSFKTRKNFSPQQRGAITRRANQMRSAFLTQRTLQRERGSDFIKYDYVKTTGKALQAAKKIWGSTLVVGKQGFLIPRGNGVTKGRKTVRVWVDKQGNIRRKVRGSKEAYISIDNEKLVEDELAYVLKLVAPYIVPNDIQRKAFPNYSWGTEITGKGDEFLRFGLLMYGHLGREFKSLNILLSDLSKYIIDAVRNGIEGDEEGLEIQGIIAIRP